MSNPFATTAPKTEVGQAPQAAPAAAPQAAPAAAPAAAPVTDEKKTRKKPAPQLTEEQRKTIIKEYNGKTTSQIAQELSTPGAEVTRQQVYRTIYEGRKTMKERAEAAAQAGDNETAQKINDFIAKYLPEKPFGGGGGTRTSSIESVVDSFLDGL